MYSTANDIPHFPAVHGHPHAPPPTVPPLLPRKPPEPRLTQPLQCLRKPELHQQVQRDIKWIIYKISDDWKEIVVEETSNEANFDVFREKLLNAKSKDRRGKEGIGGRYAVYDVEYDLPGGEGTRSKITFIAWCPDDAPQYVSYIQHLFI
jgi:hypothetical protein